MSTPVRKTVVYYNGGDRYLGQHELTRTDRKEWIDSAKEEGQIGYLSGYRYFDNRSDAVLVFFTQKPSEDEIEKRRRNGLRRAKWYWIQR